jgi:hypothetical protein
MALPEAMLVKHPAMPNQQLWDSALTRPGLCFCRKLYRKVGNPCTLFISGIPVFADLRRS